MGIIYVVKVHESPMSTPGFGVNGVIRSTENDNVTTIIAHLKEGSVDVEVGDTVYLNVTRIGAVGDAGRSTGPHVHQEIRYDNIPVAPYVFDQELTR